MTHFFADRNSALRIKHWSDLINAQFRIPNFLAEGRLRFITAAFVLLPLGSIPRPELRDLREFLK
jgi:hypothetical protein